MEKVNIDKPIENKDTKVHTIKKITNYKEEFKEYLKTIDYLNNK